jgi:hypothetical protein
VRYANSWCMINLDFGVGREPSRQKARLPTPFLRGGPAGVDGERGVPPTAGAGAETGAAGSGGAESAAELVVPPTRERVAPAADDGSASPLCGNRDPDPEMHQVCLAEEPAPEPDAEEPVPAPLTPAAAELYQPYFPRADRRGLKSFEPPVRNHLRLDWSPGACTHAVYGASLFRALSRRLPFKRPRARRRRTTFARTA